MRNQPISSLFFRPETEEERKIRKEKERKEKEEKYRKEGRRPETEEERRISKIQLFTKLGKVIYKLILVFNPFCLI